MKEVKEGPFVGEETVVIFLEGEKVVEVVLKVMVEMEEVAVVVVVFERKGLPRAGIFLATFFWRPLPHCPFSSSNWWWCPFLLFGLLVFFFFIFLDVGDTAVAGGTGAADVIGVAGVADVFGVVLGAGVVGTFGEVGASVFCDSDGAAAGSRALVCF